MSPQAEVAYRTGFRDGWAEAERATAALCECGCMDWLEPDDGEMQRPALVLVKDTAAGL